jgi:hypothetical protein
LNFVDQRRTTMKLTTIALAAAFALSSTVALAYTNQHRSGHKTHHGTVSSAQTYKGSMNRYGGSSNNRGGLVGGADSGTYRP